MRINSKLKRMPFNIIITRNSKKKKKNSKQHYILQKILF